MADATTGGNGDPPLPVTSVIRACGLCEYLTNMLIQGFGVNDIMSMAYFVSEMLRCPRHNATIHVTLSDTGLSPLQLKRLAACFFLFVEYVARQGEETFEYTEKSTGAFADNHGLNVLNPGEERTDQGGKKRSAPTKDEGRMINHQGGENGPSFEAKLDAKIKSITQTTIHGDVRHDKVDRAGCLKAIHGDLDHSKYIDMMETRFVAEHFESSLNGFIQNHQIRVGKRSDVYANKDRLKRTIDYWRNIKKHKENDKRPKQEE